MAKLEVIKGASAGNRHLCRGCTHGHFVTGYRESDVMVICTNVMPNRRVPFVVRECSEFWDRNRPTYAEMTRLALNFSDGRRKPTPGFRARGLATVPVEAEDKVGDESD